MRGPQLHSLLQLLSSSSALPKIKSQTLTPQIHAQLLVNNLLSPSSSPPFLTTKLLQLYADSSLLPSALSLFSSLPHPNVFAWTSLIAAFSRAGDLPRCLHFYRRMRAAGVPPDGYVVPVVLRSAADASVVGAVHGQAVKFGVDGVGNVHVGNALVFGYGSCGEIEEAGKVFDEMGQRDVLSWNSMISVYVSVGSVDLAVELVRCMESDGHQPDTVTWNTLMDGYCRAGRCTAALPIFRRIVDPSVVSWTTMILGYSRSGNHEAALNFFRKMIRESTVPPDRDTLSCVLSSCRHLSALGNACELHAYGLKTVPAPAFYRNAGAALLATYAGCRRALAARYVFLAMDPTDAVTWNAVISGLLNSGLNAAALDHFRDMQSRGTRSDQTTITTVLRACNLKLGREVHAHVVRNYYESATGVCNALITTYSRSGCISAARAVFSHMSSRDVVSYNSMINAYALSGLGEPAVQLVSEMDRTGVPGDEVTLTSVLTACSRSGLVDSGLGLLEKVSRVSGLDLGVEHYACVVDLLGRAGRFEEAVAFIRRMPARPSGSAVWGALLTAGQLHQRVEYGRVAFEELIRIEPENAGNYVTMANLYARAGRWEEAKAVRRLMDERGVVKPSGSSWIEGG